ncbi:hypothetical protein ACQKM2_21640 [Streptomyces sp. NPDC004126]|uniref:hypothetical protein n=1 Tax=Streptomyces sp. NPDC004126 TaxID=3390695 RepID=UPI003D029AC6
MQPTAPPLVREALPALTAELVRLLEEEGEPDLATCAYDLRLYAECGCGDDFCQSIRTGTHQQGTPYGPGARYVHLLPDRGMINLDVLHGRIEYVEVIDRPDLRLPPSPSPQGRDEGEHPRP